MNSLRSRHGGNGDGRELPGRDPAAVAARPARARCEPAACDPARRRPVAAYGARRHRDGPGVATWHGATWGLVAIPHACSVGAQRPPTGGI